MVKTGRNAKRGTVVYRGPRRVYNQRDERGTSYLLFVLLVSESLGSLSSFSSTVWLRASELHGNCASGRPPNRAYQQLRGGREISHATTNRSYYV